MADNLEINAKDREEIMRDGRWYLYFSLITLFFIAISAILKNYTFTAIIILSSGIIMIRTHKIPAMIKLIISDSAIKIDGIEHPYDSIENFSIYELDSKTHFTFKKKGSFAPAINCLIADPSPIRARLNNLVPEVEYQESFIEMLERILKI